MMVIKASIFIKKRFARLPGLLAVAALVLPVLALIFSPAGAVAADIIVTRHLPATVTAGQTFQVSVTFSVPGQDMNGVGTTDIAPAGWNVTVDKSWCSPPADMSSANTNKAEYIWFGGAGKYAQGTAFTVVYQVSVPAGATPGSYTFGGGQLIYYLGPNGPFTASVSGDATVSIPAPPAPPSGGGGGGGGGGSGLTQTSMQVRSSDGRATINVPANTLVLDAQGRPQPTLSAVPSSSPPPAPTRQAIILAYNCGPDGATFSPPITLTLSYDPTSMGVGVSENTLSIAYWNGSEWLALQSTVDTTGKTVSATVVSHFTQFAILARQPEPAAFAVLGVNVSPAQVKPGDAVNISVIVANSGGVPGTYVVALRLNGTEEQRKEVVLAAGESQTASFVVNKASPGTYAVDVNGSPGQFIVSNSPAPVVAPPPVSSPALTPKPATPAPTTSPAVKPPASTAATPALSISPNPLPAGLSPTPAPVSSTASPSTVAPAAAAPPRPRTAPASSSIDWVLVGPAAGVILILVVLLVLKVRSGKK